MLDTRRSFLSSLVATGAFAFLRQQPPTPIRSRSKSRPDVPEPGGSQLPSAQPQPGAKGANRALLLQHEKEFRETTEQLFAKIRELKMQLDSTQTADIFSLTILKQTQEIEQLAKQLKNRAKP